MRKTICIGLVGLFLGCSQAAPSGDREVEQVIAWARRGYMETTGVVHVVIGDKTTPPSDNWPMEGRAFPHAEEIVLKLLATNDARLERILAVQALGYVGSAKCVPVLAELRNDAEVGQVAVMSLYELALPECVTPLADVVIYSRHKTSRYYAAEGLAKIRDPRAVEALKQAISEEEVEAEWLKKAVGKAEELMRAGEVGGGDAEPRSD